MDKPEPQVECLARHKHNFDPLKVSRWVSDKEIDRMRRAMEDRRRVGRGGGRNFKKGDSVRVTDGPFRDLTALVEEIGMGSVKISVELFGRATPASIRPDQIERAA